MLMDCPNPGVLAVLLLDCPPNREEAPKPDGAELCGPFWAAPRIDRPPPVAGLSSAGFVAVPKLVNPVVLGVVAVAPKPKVGLVADVDVPNPPPVAPPKRAPFGVLAAAPNTPPPVDGWRGATLGLLLASPAAVLG